MIWLHTKGLAVISVAKISYF